MARKSGTRSPTRFLGGRPRWRSTVTDAWVDESEAEIDDNIRDNDEHGGEQHRAHDHENVELADGADGLLSDSRQAKDGLDNEDAS
jgi:hypothetical protein